MAKWGVYGTKDATSVRSVVNLHAAAANMRRARVGDFTAGNAATPADLAFSWTIQRLSALGTATSLTPNAKDPADTLASTIVAHNIVTVDPTITASALLYGFAMNTRATFRWVAAPGDELVIPATVSAGIMFGLSAATTTATFAVGVGYEEL